MMNINADGFVWFTQSFQNKQCTSETSYKKKSCNKNPSTKSTILGDRKEAGVYMGELKQCDQKDGGVWNGRGVEETGGCVIFLNKKTKPL